MCKASVCVDGELRARLRESIGSLSASSLVATISQDCVAICYHGQCEDWWYCSDICSMQTLFGTVISGSEESM